MMTPDRDSPCYGAMSVAGNPKDNLRPEFMMSMASVCSCFGFAPGADTVYRGILGYGAHRRMHRDKPLHLSHDCSIMLSAIDTEAKLREFLPIVEQMVQEGLVVLSDVEIIKYAHRPIETGEGKGSAEATA